MPVCSELSLSGVNFGKKMNIVILSNVPVRIWLLKPTYDVKSMLQGFICHLPFENRATDGFTPSRQSSPFFSENDGNQQTHPDHFPKKSVNFDETV